MRHSEMLAEINGCSQCANPNLKGLHSCGKAAPEPTDPNVVALKEGYLMGFEHGYVQLIAQHFGQFLSDGTVQSIRQHARSIAGRTWVNVAKEAVSEGKQ